MVFASHSIQSETKINEKIVPIGSEYQNSIKLLNNRFRVDSDISEVTVVFFREFGTPPIVLVRPDGSKLYLDNDHMDDSYDWFETEEYDMISLKNPMPGPWQAVGEILPESRVMVIADITLNAQNIPDVVYSGETLKQTAFLENAGSKMDVKSFRDVVSLSIDFVSTNNPSFPNFGLGSRTVARFEDNGLGFDEKDSDNIFTGQFNLQIVEGEWRPIFTLRTPLFSREQVGEKVVLRANPVKLSHQLGEDDDSHQLIVDVDRNEVKIESLIFEGSVRYPNGDLEKFSFTESSDLARQFLFSNKDYGIYKVNISAFVDTLTGRNLVLSLPEYSFVTEAPPPPVIEAPPAELAAIEGQNTPLLESIEEDSSNEFSIINIVLINLAVLIVGILGLLFIMDKRNNPNNPFHARLLSKLFSKKDKTATAS